MARPVSHDDALRDRLLKTTADIVVDRGQHATSLRDIATSAQTSTTAVYTLFGSKSGLMEAVLNYAFTSFGKAQTAASKDGLRALGMAYRKWALENRNLYLFMFGGVNSGNHPTVPDPESAAQTFKPLVDAVVQAQQEGRFRRDLGPVQIATAIWAQAHGMVSLELGSMGDPRTDWDQIYSILLDAAELSWAAPHATNPA